MSHFVSVHVNVRSIFRYISDLNTCHAVRHIPTSWYQLWIPQLCRFLSVPKIMNPYNIVIVYGRSGCDDGDK